VSEGSRDSLEALTAAQQQRVPAGLEAPPRGPAMGSRFALATDHPLASMTAATVLQAGGNAVDATIAAAAVNVVTKPNRTHLGGDAFALVWRRDKGEVEGLNAGGRAPLAATPEAFAGGIPRTGPRASTVPGLVDSWVELHARHGSLPLARLLEPAIRFAAEGFPVSLHLSAGMASLAGRAERDLARAFLKPDGSAYAPGETFRQPELAETLRAIAAEGRWGFYGGRVGNAIADAMRAAGGLMTLDDLAAPAAHWQQPLSSKYRGCTVFEQAPPSQGLVLLEALNVAKHFPLAEWGMTSADSVHVLVEATRLAFADVRARVGDPEFVDVPIGRLLSEDHAAELAARIDLRRAGSAAPVTIASDTTSFVVAAGEMAVCYIQSVFAPWGSRFVVPGTGILMNNRMTGFSLDPAGPNLVAPGKRTLHTLNNFLVVRDGRLVVGGGTPGADFQVQTNLQVIAGVLDWGLDIQAAVDSPRWATATGGRLNVEGRFPGSVQADLAARGHDVRPAAAWGVRACSQLVASVDGGWAAASDLRGEGAAAAF